MGWLAGAFYVLNGASSIAFEILWFRMLSNVLGAGAPTVAVVLAAWMLGQALGSWALSRPRWRGVPPALGYAACEGIAAAWGLLMIPLVAHLPHLAGAASLGGRSLWAFALLLPPTVCLGATFPWLCRFEAGGVARVYTWNVLGAAGGCFWAAWGLLPGLGLVGASLAACAVKALLAAGAAALRRRVAPPVVAAEGARGSGILALAFAFGAWGLAAQVVWTRMLTLLFSNATYALAMILIVFFLGLALGSLASRGLLPLGRPRLVLGFLCILLGVGLLLSVRAYGAVLSANAGSMELWEAARRTRYLCGYAVQSLAMMLLPTACLGAAFPLLAAGAGAARVYAANTLGGLLGCLGASFFLIPFLGRFEIGLALIAASCLLGGLSCLVTLPKRRLAPAAWLGLLLALGIGGWEIRRAVGGEPVALRKAILQGVHHRVTWSDGRVQEVRHADLFDVVHYEEGIACTAAVLRDRKTGDLHLLVDNFFVAGTGPEYAYMRVEGHLPALLAPGQAKALVVGLGTGSTLGALALHPFGAIDVMEIAPEVPRAARWFQAIQGKALEDPRVRVILDDARSALLATPNRYDVITCEPPIPYLSGGSALFTRDFYEACRARLRPGGVCCQWIPQTLYAEDSRLLVRTFQAVFPETSFWFVRNTLLLLGADAPLALDFPEVARRMGEREAVRRDLAAYGLDQPASLLSLLWAGPRGTARFAGETEGAVLTADRPLLEYYRGRGPIRPSMAEAWRGLATCQEEISPFVARWAERPGEEAVQRAWLSRYRDLSGCAYAWNQVRLEPYLDRAERFEAIARRAAPLLPPGVTPHAFFEGRLPGTYGPGT
jgi:spermidine synthase